MVELRCEMGDSQRGPEPLRTEPEVATALEAVTRKPAKIQ
jgi:hypothetical protein